ncbi:hypothetical protein NKH18_49680 [Streptomyces sp. M10(2022)]
MVRRRVRCCSYGGGVPSGSALADETHTDSHNAPRVSLVQVGQVDDPLEDVLEHAAVLGTTYVFD